jgi:peptidoglycan/LPS O-acetylase OafA/YrhL
MPALDGFRGVAVLLVVLCHLAKFRWGPYGVDMFFALSGFLIGGQLLADDPRAPGYFSAFYVRRAFRILPVYLILLASYALFCPAELRGGEPRWIYAAFVQNFWHLAPRWTGPAWSLAVEEQFYLVLPLAIARCPRRLVPAWCVGAAGFAQVFRFSLSLLHRGGAPQYFWTFSRLDGLALGVLAAWCLAEGRVPARSDLLLLAACATSVVVGGGAPMGSVYTFAAVASSSVVLLIAGTGDGSPWARPYLRWLGARSYAVYLLHFPIASTVQLRMDGEVSGIGADSPHAGSFFAAIACTLLAAELSWWLVERPALAAGRRISARLRRAPGTRDATGSCRLKGGAHAEPHDHDPGPAAEPGSAVEALP